MDPYQTRRLAMAGKRRKARQRPHRRGAPVESEESLDPLFGVAFGSPRAREQAEKAELTWRHFAESQVVPTGEKGYLTDDVSKIVRQHQTPEEE